MEELFELTRPDEMSTRAVALIALAEAVDSTTNKVAKEALLKMMDEIVFSVSEPRGTVFEVDFSPDADFD